MQQITKFQIKDVDASTISGDMSLNTLVITSTTDATSTITGSLRTLGGLGVSQTIYTNLLEVTSIDDATSTTTGSIQTLGGLGVAKSIYANTLDITSTTNATSTATGSIQTLGGIGVAQTIYAGNLEITSTTNATSTATGSIHTLGGLGVTQTIYANRLDITSIDDATSTTTGSIQTLGGIGTAKAIYAGGDITAFSDKRLKTNIEKIDNALEKTCSLNGYVYDRTDMELRQTGLIAQEVLAVLPEAVKGSDEEMYGINYGSLMGLMVEAIKELRAEVSDLKKAMNTK